MAKRGRKKKKSTKKEEFDLKRTIIGLVLVVLCILGIGNLGIVGKIITGISVIFFGSMWLLFLLLIFIVGGYLIIKNKWPDFFDTKLVGFYIFLIGFLMLLHKDFVLNYNSSQIFSNTISKLNDTFMVLFNGGSIENWFSNGGGIIGCLFAMPISLLCSFTGMIIISIVLMIIGVLVFTGFSIVDFINDRITDHKNRKEEDSDDEDEEEDKEKDHKKKFSLFGKDEDDDVPTEGDQMALSFDNVPVNGQTAIGKKRINSIEELNKPKVEVKEEKKEEEKVIINENYKLPPITLLKKPKNVDNEIDRDSVNNNWKKLIDVLAAFGIKATPMGVSVGPAVSQYELEIASGTRLNKVTALNAEIASALAKKDVRIQAPIPGKSTVGIEFANDNPSSVSFYEMMDSEQMKGNLNKKLLVPLGKNIEGEIGVCEVNKMPHLLIAGTTGSGKSVCVNGIICAILMRCRPDEVKLAMVDPKVVELSVYNGIPHLLAPVVSDPKKAAVLLAKMVQEMEDRYSKFADTSTKKIEAYNEYIEKWNNEHPDAIKAKMPYIVVIIDELADLMMVAAKEVEDSILRITQKARAAGIHLIVATQRPSTEVITGLIKANIPSRIAFAVGSGVDSRTILDKVGAEKLLGKGDMLYMPIGVNNPERIQGSFITDDEIQKLIDYTVEQQKAQYDDTFMNLDSLEGDSGSTGGGDFTGTSSGDDDDPIYNEVVEFVISSQKASASLLQRKFKVGYNRAARLVELLEERGIIGPQNGSKPREVLVQFGQDESSSSDEIKFDPETGEVIDN